MKKFEEYFSIIYILGFFLIPICIVLLIYYTFVGKSYYNVNSKNEETISMLLSQVTEIKEENKLKRIGYMQGLREWILYFDYKDGTNDEIVLKDHEAHDLYMYIKQNGSIAGTKGKVAKYTLILSISVIIIDKVLLIINKNRKKYQEL